MFVHKCKYIHFKIKIPSKVKNLNFTSALYLSPAKRQRPLKYCKRIFYSNM